MIFSPNNSSEQEMENIYLSLSGIPVSTAEILEGQLYFSRDPQGAWYPTSGNKLYEIDTACAHLQNDLAKIIFGSLDLFYEFLRASPELLSTAGTNSESQISKDVFNQIISSLPKDLPVHKALYLFDCRKLVSGIQECSKEIMQLQGEFFQALNLEQLFYPTIEEEDGLRFVTSPVVTKIHALLGFIFIRLHSLLDYATKLAFETENLKSNFNSYPKLASKGLLFGDRRKLTLNNTENTLFEDCSLINKIQTLRNHIIHDGVLDDEPKVYRLISAKQCIEKFVLIPDQDENGRFYTHKNRNLFYGSDNKINEQLPFLIEEFQARLLKTVDLLRVHIVQKQKSNVGPLSLS
ncbi:hypothetical protein [Aliidiomarina soli]|uniref:Uncharacterized protein n=1 Tax=Aliidiomarina soli TaxID=1928574 RepID=A0A432WF46_9GAMM|nr:hypothetical protein [Aliidiomarina soli]RUO32422.1 hypothetical protein CWE14_09750 [Aliidiomarina soli]